MVVDNETYEVIAKEKCPTTHHAKQGVAEGIVRNIENVLKKNNISPEDVIFIAHGTTQATNALLEGDVAKVGIVGMGKGLEADRAKKMKQPLEILNWHQENSFIQNMNS